MESRIEISSRRRNELAADLVARIGAAENARRPIAGAALIVAHPDDEAVGAGALLPRLHEPWLLYVTDGAPRDLADAMAAGRATREAYAAARRQERSAALAIAGIDAARAEELGVVDQEASLQLADLTRAIAAWLAARRPQAVLTHPYEGGHPDHDAVAFAVHAACRQWEQRGTPLPAVVEMTSYHLHNGRICVSEFLPLGQTCASGHEASVTTCELSETERQFKRRLFACYATQRATLSWFSIERERFRAAPRYDFTRPPHDGPLFYEQFPWGMTGERFRRLAAEALRQLELDPP